MKNQISAKIVADSINQQRDRITTMEIVFPRPILAEFNTHRLFTRNSASSRAIPFKKMVEMVKNSPFIPIAWQKDHSGMQGTEYFEGWRAKILNLAWKAGAKSAVFAATKLHKLGLTKQLCNRLLEPFMYHKVLVTFTETENFFNLRCPQYEDTYRNEIYKSRKDMCDDWNREHLSGLPKQDSTLEWLKINKGQGEIHIMDLAEKMWDAMNESIPVKLNSGQWHIPYGDNISDENANDYLENIYDIRKDGLWGQKEIEEFKCKIAVARCARLSYQTLGDNPVIDYKADLKLFDILKNSGHFSPFEHVARCMSNEEYRSYIKGKCVINSISDEVIAPVINEGWCNNFKGFIQYRYLLES